MDKISIVIPCYNEEETIDIYYKTTIDVLNKMKTNYELIFVDDGSKDNTLKILKTLNAKDANVKYISFSRNFGKEAAIYAGLIKSTGNFACTMDVDLQDPPDLIPQMYKILKEDDYDCVSTRRKTRKGEPKIRSFFARQFYKLINKLVDDKIEIVDGARDFRLMKRQMVDAVIKISESDRFSKGIFSYVGFKTKWLSYENKPRVAGNTKWSFKKLFAYAISGIISFSTKLLILPFIFGFTFLLISFILLIILIINYNSILLMILLNLFCFAILFTLMGINGLYTKRMFVEAKNRPIYIIREED